MERKKIWWAIGLLVLMWMSVTGQYLSVPGLYDSAWWLGLIDVGVITAVMMIVPFICRLVNRERLETIKGKKICKWNSIGMFILSVVLTVALSDGNGFVGIGGVGALIFYYINKWVFVYDEKAIKTPRKIKKEKVQEKIVVAEEIEQPIKAETTKNKYCKLCGGKLDANNKCRKCGKQYFKFNKSLLLYIIIGLLVVTNVITIFICIDKNRELDDVIYGCNENDSSWCESQLDSITGEHSTFYVQEKLDFFDENIVFVIEGYGNYYYTYDCVQKITDGEEYTYWAYNKEAAKVHGYQKGTCY